MNTSVPLYCAAISAFLGYVLGAGVTYWLYARERKIIKDLAHAKDAGELQDVKDEVDGFTE